MCLDRDYIVEGSLSLDDDGRALRLHRLADGAAVRWLAVREGTPSPLLLDEDHELPIERGAPTELRHGGAPYRLERRASTRARRMGQVGPRLAARQGDRATLFEYAGVGDKRIVAVSWPDGTDGFVGATVHRALVEILPGA